AATRSPHRKYQWSTAAASGRSRSPTWSPADRYEVVRDPGWEVTPARPVATWSVTARLDPAATATSTGSDSTSPPAGTATDRRPPNVTPRTVPGSTALTPAAPPRGSATVTALRW